VVLVVGLFFLNAADEEGSAVVFPWDFLSVQVVPLAGLRRVLEWLAGILKSWCYAWTLRIVNTRLEYLQVSI